MFNKYVFITILFILAILLIILGVYLFTYNPHKNLNNKYESDEIYNCKECSIENFSSTIKENYDNLIGNGNFENGTDITNPVNKSGINKIISKPNPGKSSYVLQQQKSSELTFYQITCDSVKNSKYIFFFWMCVSNNDNMIVENLNNMNFQNLIKIKILNEDNSSYNVKLNFSVVQKIIIENNQSAWFLIKYDFITGPNIQNTMNIFLNYSSNIMFDNFYFTNVSLYRSLIDAENFIYNRQLISYVDGYHYESNSETWHDLSGSGNDLFWSSIPKVDNDKGCINTLNYKLTGFSSNKFISDKFCILIVLNKGDSVEESVEESDSEDKYLISIPGNDKYAFEIKLVDKNLHLIYDSNDVVSSREIILYNKGLLAILFDNNNINIFHDGINILSTTIRKCYFNSDKIIINRNSNLNVNLYSLLFFVRIIESIELDKIREYFIMNNNKNFSKIDINIYHMSANAEYSAIYDNNNYLVNPEDKKYIYNNYTHYEEDYDIDFDNVDTRIKIANGRKCFNECTNLCNIFLKNGNSSKHTECINNCKNVLNSCYNFCNIEDNKSNPYCSGTINPSEIVDNQCPTVSLKDGNYIVYLAPNTYYANLYNYSGERNYGKSMARARRLYHINFPKCPIPDILIPSGGHPFNNTCPYVVNELNPCHVSVCADVNWDVTDFNDLNLDKPCKKIVSNYCQINYELDDKCICWDPKYKDDPKCIEFRKYFEDPTDYCAPSQFNIEDHPDFNKYIKKNNIPCWGCTVDSVDDDSD